MTVEKEWLDWDRTFTSTNHEVLSRTAKATPYYELSLPLSFKPSYQVRSLDVK